MIESKAKPSEVISDKAANRLLADIAVDVDSSAAWAEKVVCERLGEPVSVFVYRVRYTSRITGETVLYWRVAVESDTIYVSAEKPVLNEAVSSAVHKFGVQARVNKQMAEVEAADKATRDDGEATAGTLPLVKLGPGGDFTSEVRP